AKTAAQWTLFHTIRDMLKLMAPVTPHLTEEIYRTMYDADNSITLSAWPEYDESLVDEDAERIGDMVIETISSVRTEKNKQGVSLNKPVKQLSIYAGDHAGDLKLGTQDIMDTLKVESLEILGSEGGDAKVEAYDFIGFTMEIVVES
ncbi:class I tRNA ligase family protein, partial [Candidatus Bathyarchaeota archaeon]|nr:class I tRNA ligase family protein [Candidatus Bathyarchaeota archaeon]